jgi:hypothetical protein
MEDHLFTIASLLVGLMANGLAGLLFWRIKRLDEDVEVLKQEIHQIQMNYLNRFQDVKDHNTVLHLQILEKLAILEKGLVALTATQATENRLQDIDRKKHNAN